MRTEYDDDPEPQLPPGKKLSKAERRAIATEKARKVKCTNCNHPVPDHRNLAGIERSLGLWWCDVCNCKCRKEDNLYA